MILATAVALAISLAAEVPATISAPILVQFDPAKLSALDSWDGSLDRLERELKVSLGLPDQATLRANALTRLKRGKDAPPDFALWMLLSIPVDSRDWLTMEALVKRLSALPFVAHAELDHDAAGWKFDAVPRGPKAPHLELDDPFSPDQYALQQIHAPEAWAITTGAPFVTVAVLDSGFDPYLPDLAGRLLPGYDFVAEAATLKPGGRHGAAIAELIAATGNDCEGIAGIDWQCRVLPVNMTTGGVAVWAEALEFAIEHNVDVINISGKLSLGAPSALLDGLLERASNAGIIVVASAGNLDRPVLSWPASSPFVIAVGATDGFDARWRRPLGVGSNYGPKLDLVAPGESIVTLDRDGHRVQLEGTSAAAALVSGACCLMRAMNPLLGPAEAREILHKTATRIGSASAWHKGRHPEFGSGLLNVGSAVKAARDATLPGSRPKPQNKP